MIETDKEIILLETECCIHLPTKEVKRKITDKISEKILVFIDVLQTEAEERILNDIDEKERIYQEMLNLELRRVHKMFSSNQSVNLRKLCQRNNIANECDAVKELEELASEFVRHQSPKDCESVLCNDKFVTNVSDDDDEEPLCMLIESENDEEETMANLQCTNTISMKNAKCFCFECVLKYISDNGDRKRKYMNIFKIFKYVLMLPSTQVKCERDFSRMKLIKTRLRSNLSETSLQNLLLISAESELFHQVSLEQIIDDLVAQSRKLALHMWL